MKLRALLPALALLALAVVFGRSSERPGTVEVARLQEENWKQFVPAGKEVDAIYGDFVLRNGHLVAVIAQPVATRNANMTVRDVAGALLDLTVRDAQSDQLSAFYPGRRAHPFRTARATLNEGTAVDFSKPAASGKSGAVIVSAEPAEGRPAVEVTYSLEADAAWLTVTTKFTNAGDKPLTVPLEDDLRADGQKEDMVRAANGVHEVFWVHDRFWEQAYGVVAPQAQIQVNSDPRTSVLKYQMNNGQDNVELQPGASFELVRRVFPGASLLDVRAISQSMNGASLKPVAIAVRDGQGRPIPGATVDIARAGQSRGTARTNAQGQLATSLPAGMYTVSVSAYGIVVGQDFPIEVTQEEADARPFLIELAGYRPGRVVAQITDASGGPCPCKVQFLPKPGTAMPDFGPDTAEFAVRNICYAPLGRFEQAIPPGEYDVIVSHGPEFDAIFTELTVPPGETVPLRGELVRSVDTPGWVSSDFHSHSSPSGDNTGSQLGRVLNLVCEHIEFAPCTEHNRISTYVPHIERLGIGAFIGTVSGMELTGQPLPLNHQNAFPLEMKPNTQDGGAPQTDGDVEKQIERLALWDNRGEKLVQQNHPDIGWLFYDKDGDGQHDSGYERAFGFMDVIEIHPMENALNLQPIETLAGRSGNNRIFNWMQLLNQGFRIPGVVNTDAHYNFHGSGWLRNWIQCGTDDPAAIQPLEIVRASEQGRLIMSNGPYLEVTLSAEVSREGVTAGQDLRAAGGKATLRARVQCPNWLDVDRVFVLVNGKIHPRHHYTREEHPDAFRSGVVKFEREMPLELEGDAHIVVVAGGEKQTLGPVMGPDMGKHRPAAMSNPIFVDVDGEGFRANGDTLGAPLPVKYDPNRGR